MSDRDYPGYLGLAALAVSVAITFGTGTQQPVALAAPSAPTSDEHGYVGSTARCDDTQTLMAYGRTTRALVVICVSPDGQLEYRGVRVSDQAGLTMPASRAADGIIVAANNGVTYAVSPAMLLVSEGDSVLYRDSWIEFRQPRFSGPSRTSTATTTATTSTVGSSVATATSVPAASSTTVSTTTVTLTPSTPAPPMSAPPMPAPPMPKPGS